MKVFSGSVFFLSCVCVCFLLFGILCLFSSCWKRKKKCKKHIPGYGPIFSLSFAFWFEPSSLTDASGESMENALRACCKGIKIGKILIHREGDNGQQVGQISFSLYPCLPCTDTLHTCMHRYLSTNILTVFLCFNDWTANLWKTSKRYLRQACVTLGSCPRHRFVCSRDVKILFLSTQ